MFRRARIRLTVLYIGLFGLALAVFSLVFYLGFATVLAPTFDLAPELSNEQIADVAYQTTLERIGLALVIADVIVVVLVGLAAWILAARTLRPIRDAHARQRRFVADASHEMRTPLAAIRASAEGALAGPATEDELRGALAVIAGSADRLTRITNDLLLLARTQELPGDRREAVDVSVIVAETVEAFAAAHPAAPRPHVALAADLRVTADPDEVGRIVANLLDNAVRYGARTATSAARIVTRTSDREAWVEVGDDGPGIVEADVDRIFEPFHRVRSDAAGPEGSGLGLAIARGLAERNGGRLTVVSQPGAGATFRLSLPRFR
jgi:signal transduction histidine kinase